MIKSARRYRSGVGYYRVSGPTDRASTAAAIIAGAVGYAFGRTPKDE